jgi:hypothetical protein
MNMQDVTLVWKDQEFKVEARKVLPMIMRIEEIITLGELISESQTGNIRLGRIAKAYGEALRYAGAEATDDEVYQGLFATGDKTVIIRSIHALTAIMFPMIPPEHLQGEAKEGKKKAVAEGGSTSKRRTKPLSSGG